MLSVEGRALLLSAIEKSGGIAKWRELLDAWRRSCRSRDRAGIADLVRRSARTDDGAVQLAVLVLLGLSLSETAFTRMGERDNADSEGPELRREL